MTALWNERNTDSNECEKIWVHEQRSRIYVKAVHVFHLAHASIHAFPAHASLISAHASLISMDTFLMVPVHQHDGVAW